MFTRRSFKDKNNSSSRRSVDIMVVGDVNGPAGLSRGNKSVSTATPNAARPAMTSSSIPVPVHGVSTASANGCHGRPPPTSSGGSKPTSSSSRSPLLNWRSKLGLNRGGGGGGVVNESQTQQRNINNVVQVQGRVPVTTGSGVDVTNVKRVEQHTSTSAGRSKVRLAAIHRGVSADNAGSGLPSRSSSSTAVHSTFRPLNVVSSGLRYITNRSTSMDVTRRIPVANNDDKKLVTDSCVQSSSPNTVSGRLAENSSGLYDLSLPSSTDGQSVQITQSTTAEGHYGPAAGVDGPAITASRRVAQCWSDGDKLVASNRNHVDSMLITSATARQSASGSTMQPGLETPDLKRAGRQSQSQGHPGPVRGRSASSVPAIRRDMPVRHHVTQHVTQECRSNDKMNQAEINRQSSITAEFGCTETDLITSDDVNRFETVQKLPFSDHDTILPPPELFDSEDSHTHQLTASFPVEVVSDSQILLLPPPEEFDVGLLEVKTEVDHSIDEYHVSDEIVLPPPESFDNGDISGSYDVTIGVGDVCDRSHSLTLTNDRSTLTSEVHREFNGEHINALELVNNFDGRVSSLDDVGATSQTSSRTTVRVDSTSDLRSDIRSGNQLNVASHGDVTAARDRLASDAMDKLDALCRTTSIEMTSSASASTASSTSTKDNRKLPTFTSIPVYHETAVGAKTRRRRAVADSWPGGLFFRDHRPGVSVDDGVAKRHSADTSRVTLSVGGQVPSIISEDGDGARAANVPEIAAESGEVQLMPKRCLFSRYGADDREFTPRGVPCGGHLPAERHRSLEPSDARERDDVSVMCGVGTQSTQKRVDVRSESDLTDRKSTPTTATLGERMFYGERLTALSKTAAVRKNLLEQVTERRKGQHHHQVRATSAPLKNRLACSVEQFPSTITTCDLPEIKSSQTRHSTTNISPLNSSGECRVARQSEEIDRPELLDCLKVSTSLESSSAARTSIEVSRATHRRLRTERSMEVIEVSRPASIVLPSTTTSIKRTSVRDASTLCGSPAGSPVRVFVDGHLVSNNPYESVAVETPLPPSRSSSSTPIINESLNSTASLPCDDVIAANVSDDVTIPPLSPPPHAPLCCAESSFDTTSDMTSDNMTSDMPSGRTTPSTVSLLTFQDASNFGLSSPGTDSAMTDSGIGTSSHQSQPSDRHFIVVAIDFGTTYSGYAFSFVRDPDSVHMMRRWEGGDPGVVNQKTPTTLLLEPNGKFHSFGYAARDFYHDLDAQEAKRWLYFEKFKMTLHYSSELNKETTIKAANGRPYSALAVFAHALRFFHDHALEELSDQSATSIVNEDIRWVLTVPAIWKAPAKQFMREAAYQAGIASSETPSQLLIALEPEAASIYVRRLRLYQLVPEPPYVAQLRREPTPDPSCSFEHRGSDDEFMSEETVKYRTLPAVHLTPPSSTTITVGHEVDIEGTRYMVVDCGGGTVDITVYEMESRYGCLKELHKATGGPYGSVGVDLEFERLLVAIFGSDFIETFKVKRPAGWVDLMGSFESRKRTASPFKNTPLNVALPFSFIDYHKKCRVGHVENAVRKYGSREVTWSSQGMLRLTVEAMRRLFQPTLDRIKQSIGDVLNHPCARDIRYMFLVGGFSESPMLQLEMRKEFSHLLKIIIPQDVALTILKGAVIFGIDPTVVGVRRSRLTYGVGVLNRFVPGKHLSSKKITRDGTSWCLDVFDRFVAVDQEVAVGDVVVRSYAPARPGQRSTVIHIYCSDRTDIEYVTDPGVRRCGTLCLDLTDSLYHDPDVITPNHNGGGTSKNRRREIKARMTFGDTEIRVDAVDVATGRSVRAGIDFLNK